MNESNVYSELELRDLFNEWQDWYEADPRAFMLELELFRQREAERLKGEPPSYGLDCVRTLNLCRDRLAKRSKSE